MPIFAAKTDSILLMRSFLLFPIVILMIQACGKSKVSQNLSDFDLKDETVQQIFNIADRRDTKNLLTFLAHDDKSYRYLAAVLLGSIQDSTTIMPLSRLLNDPEAQVREVAASSLGQIGKKEAVQPLIEAFKGMRKDTLREVQAAILEAIGKVGDKKLLAQMATAPNYSNNDHKILAGQARGIYQFALRDSIAPEGTKRMIELLTGLDITSDVRFVAANYFFRTKDIDLKPYSKLLIESLKKEDVPNVKMISVIAAAKSRDTLVGKEIMEMYKTEQNLGVRVNMVRAMKFMPYDSIRTFVFNQFYDKNANIQMAAAESFYEAGQIKDGFEYIRVADLPSTNWRARLELYKAAMKHGGPQLKTNATNMLIAKFAVSPDDYEKAAILHTMAELPWNYAFAINQVFNTDSTASIKSSPVVASAGLEVAKDVLLNPNFNFNFGMGAFRVRKEIHDAFFKAIKSGDPGLMAIAGEGIANPNSGYKLSYPDFTMLVQAQQKLSLPLDIEAYLALGKAIEAMGGPKPDKTRPDFNNPIDWSSLLGLPKDVTAIVETAKGRFGFKLLPHAAPGTVSYFAKLAKAGYYNGKVFHRVLPNFVAQTGCPRGDGYGGSEKSVRSEFSKFRFDEEGWVGMASAGPDTEGAQFFITLAPAPHLDGGYTIFGKVTNGLDVLQSLEMGDKIVKLEIR